MCSTETLHQHSRPSHECHDVLVWIRHSSDTRINLLPLHRSNSALQFLLHKCHEIHNSAKTLHRSTRTLRVTRSRRKLMFLPMPLRRAPKGRKLSRMAGEYSEVYKDDSFDLNTRRFRTIDFQLNHTIDEKRIRPLANNNCGSDSDINWLVTWRWSSFVLLRKMEKKKNWKIDRNETTWLRFSCFQYKSNPNDVVGVDMAERMGEKCQKEKNPLIHCDYFRFAAIEMRTPFVQDANCHAQNAHTPNNTVIALNGSGMPYAIFLCHSFVALVMRRTHTHTHSQSANAYVSRFVWLGGGAVVSADSHFGRSHFLVCVSLFIRIFLFTSSSIQLSGCACKSWSIMWRTRVLALTVTQNECQTVDLFLFGIFFVVLFSVNAIQM